MRWSRPRALPGSAASTPCRRPIMAASKSGAASSSSWNSVARAGGPTVMSIFLQYLFAGLTIGSIYALSALGFTIVYNARGLVNFVQGDFLMLGGMVTATLVPFGWPLPLAIGAAIAT